MKRFDNEITNAQKVTARKLRESAAGRLLKSDLGEHMNAVVREQKAGSSLLVIVRSPADTSKPGVVRARAVVRHDPKKEIAVTVQSASSISRPMVTYKRRQDGTVDIETAAQRLFDYAVADLKKSRS